jgi:polygalacturonase
VQPLRKLIIIFIFVYFVSALSAGKNQSHHITEINIAKEIRVGDSNADMSEFTSSAIQAAVDSLNILGGGTILLNPGEFEIIAPVKLYSNINLKGSGKETILHKIDGFISKLIDDADYGEKKLTVEDPSGFSIGMAVHIYDSKHNNAWEVFTAVITSIEGNILNIDNYLLRDYRSDRDAFVSTASSIISIVEAENVRIENLSIDGNKEKNEFINGCRGGGVYLYDVKDVLIDKIILKDFNGDGISWQMTKNVTVSHCDVSGCGKDGLHPGTGSYYTIIEENLSHHNERCGLYICWRVQNGQVRKNKFHHNNKYGICTGHKDSNILFEKNHIFQNGEDGIHFRKEREVNAPQKNIFRENIIEDNGVKGPGYGLYFNSPVKEIIIENNIIRNLILQTQIAAIYLYQKDLAVILRNNIIENHKVSDIIIGN